MKLVRVVLFLAWKDRETWRPCLEKTAEREFADESVEYPLTMPEDGGAIRRYTGHFSQYPLFAAPDKKLFGKYDIWRFLEVDKEGKKDVIVDLYVVFCEDMKRIDGVFEFTSIAPKYCGDSLPDETNPSPPTVV